MRPLAPQSYSMTLRYPATLDSMFALEAAQLRILSDVAARGQVPVTDVEAALMQEPGGTRLVTVSVEAAFPVPVERVVEIAGVALAHPIGFDEVRAAAEGPPPLPEGALPWDPVDEAEAFLRNR